MGTRAKRYIAGPLWKPAKEDPRREGDLIEDPDKAWGHAHVKRLVNRRELVEIPWGKWEYRATQKYVGVKESGEAVKPGDVVEGLDDRTVTRLLNVGHIERFDVPKDKPVDEKPPRIVPVPPVPQRFKKKRR